MPGNLDFTAWPVWLLAILMLMNLFREQIGSFVPLAIREHFSARARRQADRDEHRQEIEEALVNSRLQGEATETLRKSWREEQWVEIIQRKDAWLQDVLEKRLDGIEAVNQKMLEELVQLRHGTRRTNDILTTIHIALSRIYEAHHDEQP